MIVLNLVGMVRLPWEAQGSERGSNFLRKLIVMIFSEDIAGEGRGKEASKYEYIVENISVEDVSLSRSAHLKKGFNFLINLRNWKFSNVKNDPKHEDVISDIHLKMERMDVQKFCRLNGAIEEVFKCNEPKYILKKYRALNSYKPAARELLVNSLLKVLKWKFIEQDIRDWNHSGRNMLLSTIRKEVIGL